MLRSTKHTKKRKSNPRDNEGRISLDEYNRLHIILSKEGFKQHKKFDDVYIKDHVIVLMGKHFDIASAEILIYSEETIKDLKGKDMFESNVSYMANYPLSKKGFKYLEEDLDSLKETQKLFKRIVD